MADQIRTRFGALDRRLAAAVRHALETEIICTALAPMNAVHLRMALIDDTPDSEPSPEPPSHRWYEFMTECFGRNSVGFQNTAAWSSDSWSNLTASRRHIDFVESYRACKAEEVIIHDLLAAVGAFLVAESIAMDEQIAQWNTAVQDNCDCEEFYSIAERAGVVGFKLLEHAKAGTWRNLLWMIMYESDVSITHAQKIHTPSAPALSCAGSSEIGESFDTENRDYVVLMVDSVEAYHRKALTERALSELRETANADIGSSPKDKVLVVSAADGRQSIPLPLTFHRLDKSSNGHSSGKISIEHTLDETAKLIEVLSQPVDGVSTIASSIMRPLGRQRDLITGIRSAARAYAPILLIVLSSEYDSISQLDLSAKPNPDARGLLKDRHVTSVALSQLSDRPSRNGVTNNPPSPQELVDELRDHDLLPDLSGIPVVFLWSAPSRKAHLGAYWLAICSAAGALSCEFHFSSPKRGLASVTPSGNSFQNEDGSAGSRIVSVVKPPLVLVRRLVSRIFSIDHRVLWRALIPMAFTVVIVTVGIPAVGTMNGINLFLVLAMMLLCLGMLIGHGLQTRTFEQRERRVAQRERRMAQHVESLNEREAELKINEFLSRGEL